MTLLIDTVVPAAIVIGLLVLGRAAFWALGKATKSIMRGGDRHDHTRDDIGG